VWLFWQKLLTEKLLTTNTLCSLKVQHTRRSSLIPHQTRRFSGHGSRSRQQRRCEDASLPPGSRVCTSSLVWRHDGLQTAATAPHLNTTTTTTTVFWLIVRDHEDKPVPKETFSHPPSWSSSNLYQLLPSATIHSILPVQIMCLTSFLHNISPCPLWSTSWHLNTSVKNANCNFHWFLTNRKL